MAFYGLLLPRLGFVQKKPHIWANAEGLHIQFGPAGEDTPGYERYGPGLNHFGFSAPSVAMVEELAAVMEAAGHVARLQRFAGGTTALFLPDPDGLRVEVSGRRRSIEPQRRALKKSRSRSAASASPMPE